MPPSRTARPRCTGRCAPTTWTRPACSLRGGANAKAANRYGVTPISLAAVNGNAAVIELLLKAGADPNTTMEEGETVLMTAARTGKVDAVKALLVHGATANARESFEGETALMWAAAENHVDVTSCCSKSALTSMRGRRRWTPRS